MTSLSAWPGNDPMVCMFVVMFLIGCRGTDLIFADLKVIPSSVPRRIDNITQYYPKGLLIYKKNTSERKS